MNLFISWHYLNLTVTRFWHRLTLALSDIDIDWVLKFLSSENFLLWSFFFFFEVPFFLRYHCFWDFIFVIIFITWDYPTLSLTRSWHYLSLTLTRSWHYLAVALSDTDIDWVLEFLRSEKFWFHFFWRFHFFSYFFDLKKDQRNRQKFKEKNLLFFK